MASSSSSSSPSLLCILSPPPAHPSLCLLPTSCCSRWKRLPPLRLRLLPRHAVISIHQASAPPPPPPSPLPSSSSCLSYHGSAHAEGSAGAESHPPAPIPSNDGNGGGGGGVACSAIAPTRPRRRKARKKINAAGARLGNYDENGCVSSGEEAESLVRCVANAKDTTLYDNTTSHEDNTSFHIDVAPHVDTASLEGGAFLRDTTTSDEDTLLREDATSGEVITSCKDASFHGDATYHRRDGAIALDDGAASSEVFFSHNRAGIDGKDRERNGSKSQKRKKDSRSKNSPKQVSNDVLPMRDNLVHSTAQGNLLNGSLDAGPQSSEHVMSPIERESELNLVAKFKDVVTIEYDAKAGADVIDITDYVETVVPAVNSLQPIHQSDNTGKRKPRRRKKKGSETEDNLKGLSSEHDILLQRNAFGEGESVSMFAQMEDRDGDAQFTETMIQEGATSQDLEEKKSRLSSKRNKRSRRSDLEGSASSITPNESTCCVRWLVEAHLNANQELFLVGGHDHLGSWNPDAAVALFERKTGGQPHIWERKIQLPFGTHCEYNYFIRVGDEENHSIVWRPGAKLQLKVPSSEDAMQTDMTIKNILDFNVENKLPSFMWEGFQSEIGFPDELRRFLGGEFSLEENSSSVVGNGGDVDKSTGKQWKKPEVSGHDSEEPMKVPQTKLESGGVESKGGSKFSKKHQSDEQIPFVRLTPKLKKYIRKRVFPREEPWLMESMILYEKVNSFKSVDAISDETFEDAKESEEIIEKTPDLPLKTEKNKEISTEILISSSKCTMERIAILENGKLVELLLKQVNADINVGNVYLGIVKKLLPGMTGVFVDIGHQRVALLSINKNVYPYTFPRIIANDYDEPAMGEEDEISFDPEEPFEIDDEIDEEVLEDFNAEESQLESSLEPSFEGEVPENQGRKRLLQINGNGSKRITVNFGQRYTKWRKVEEGMRIIVQVRREPLGKKGPKVCAFPQLSSRFWILGLGGKSTGVSKKIIGQERRRLKDIANLFRKPGFDLTARTEAAGQSQEDLEKDMLRLMETWNSILEQAEAASTAADNGQDGAVPVVLHRAMGQTLSIVRDFFAEKVHRMVVDSAQTYHEVTSYLQEVAPKLLNRVELYTGTMPIFDVFNLEPEIDKLLNERVQLPNGAYLVIQETEALVSIDVNGGTGMLGKNMKSDAILEVNLAAARQIANEIRLRDIGGIIVIDFIDMDDDEHESLVSQEMRNAIQSDRSIIHILEISELGLMELTRRRVRPSVTFMITDPCSCCRGSGRIEALETTFSKIERAILRLVANHPENIHFDGRTWKRVLLRVDPVMFEFLTRKQRAAQLSSSLKVYIILKVGRDMTRGTFEVSEMKLGTEKKMLPTSEKTLSANEKKISGNSDKKISSEQQQRRIAARKGIHMGSSSGSKTGTTSAT